MKNGFEDLIQGEVPVIVDFYANWCSPCQIILPVLEKVKTTVGTNATILKMDVEKNLYYAQKFRIESIPTLMIFKKGKILWRKTGIASANEIFQHLAPHV